MSDRSLEGCLLDDLIASTRPRVDVSQPLCCPNCGSPLFRLDDHSTPPVAAWFDASCPACGLAETVHIPLGGSAFNRV
ncbi:MAG: hypothetical protein R3D33_14560 [Hyphomicrobiaceae bacterium]